MKPASSQATVQKSWPWYKVLGTALLHPTLSAAEKILAEAKVTLGRSILWQVTASLVYLVIIWILSLFYPKLGPPPASILDMLKQIASNVLVAISIPIVFSSIIHVVMCIFSKKDGWSKLVILTNIYTCLYGSLFSIVTWFIVGSTPKVNIFLSVLVMVNFVVMVVYFFMIIPLPMRAAYQIRWIWAFLLSNTIVCFFITLVMIALFLSKQGTHIPVINK
jgi:hypothetical protein